MDFMQVAWIREDACIGCTKCLQVCPVDAIIGAQKQMHTILSQDCTGCEKCQPVCPVDCIDMHPIVPQLTASQIQIRELHSLALQQAREKRLAQDERSLPQGTYTMLPLSVADRQAEIAAAILRATNK